MSQAIDIWQATLALDAVLDDGATLVGGDSETYPVERLHAAINWETGAPENDAYDTPGAPPNGGDFVRLIDGGGAFLSAGDVTDVEFQGAQELPALPVTWEVDTAPPSGADGPALHSPVGDNLNEVIVQNVAVPAGSPQLTFDAAWDLETTFDFGYAQVTDGRRRHVHEPRRAPTPWTTRTPRWATWARASVRGSTARTPHRCSRRRPATCRPTRAQTVGLAFRVFNDGGVHMEGFWVDNVAIDGTVISDGSTLDGWHVRHPVQPDRGRGLHGAARGLRLGGRR